MAAWGGPARGRSVSDANLASRKETRIPLKLFIHLYNRDSHVSEVGHTIDVSCHGAQIETRRFWKPGLAVSIRTIRGNFYSRGRVVHCRQRVGSYVVGLEMYYPEGTWTTESEPRPTAKALSKGILDPKVTEKFSSETSFRGTSRL